MSTTSTNKRVPSVGNRQQDPDVGNQQISDVSNPQVPDVDHHPMQIFWIRYDKSTRNDQDNDL